MPPGMSLSEIKIPDGPALHHGGPCAEVLRKRIFPAIRCAILAVHVMRAAIPHVATAFARITGAANAHSRETANDHEQPWADVHQSFNRCLHHSAFIRRFYTIFIESHPKIAAHFRDTDWKQQFHLLRHGISASISYADGAEILGEDELKRLYKTHGKKGYNIEGWMYDYWLDSLIQAVSEADPLYTDQLGQRWREAMGIAIAQIRDGRDTRLKRSA